MTFSKLNNKANNPILLFLFFTKFELFSATYKQIKQCKYNYGGLYESQIKVNTGQVKKTKVCLGKNKLSKAGEWEN